jgi:ABC-type branched-subunit amino acid transport system ATPase component
MVGRHVRTHSGLIGAVFRTPGFKAEEAAIRARSQELLDYVGIGRFTDYKARTLSYGDQRRLEIARALATDPKLIALDEPAAGMNATEKVVLRELIDRIRNDGRTILLIEHDVKLVMGLCDRVTVLDYGKQIAEGTPAEVQKQREGDRGLPRRRPQAALRETAHEHQRPARSLRGCASPTAASRPSRASASRCRRRARQPDRRQRRRQDDHAEGRHRHPADRRRRHQVPRQVHRRPGRVEPRQARPGDGAGRPRHLHAHDHHREPADGRARAQGQAEMQADIDKVFATFPRLKERATQLAGTMSGGEQQMLAMGRALMARPKVLLLDEPSMGLSPIMVDKIFEVIETIHKQGTTVLLVEQNASRALSIANRGYVMESGEVTMDGDADMLLNDPKVRAAYLGE